VPVADTPISAEEGKRLTELFGCVACHSSDGITAGKAGPPWNGLFGSKRIFADGSSAIADEAYLRQSIRQPAAKIIKGFEKGEIAMPPYEGLVTDTQVEALVLYLKSLH
jgi:mono/diheme cytochrome c family protein